MGAKIRWFFIIVGILAVLAVCGNIFTLKDQNQPRLPIPTEMPGLPKVNVSKR